MKDIIKNFRLSNKAFSMLLKNEHLVINEDYLVEVSFPLEIATAFYFYGIPTCVSCDLDDHLTKDMINFDNPNFIFNGELTDDMIPFIKKIANDSTTFNIGICSNNKKEFNHVKKQYMALKSALEKEYNIEINAIDKRVDDCDAYVLSYRHNK